MSGAQQSSQPGSRRRGAVAVIVEQGRLLVIRRSRHVVAPGAICFPGGAIEPGETQEQALVRELREELTVEAQPLRRLWQSVTDWQVELFWWQAALAPGSRPAAVEAEVESLHWLTPQELAEHPQLLSSNQRFLAALARGEIVLSDL